VQTLSQSLDIFKVYMNRCIVVYCRLERRSLKASRILKENGFTPLNVKGGIIRLMQNDAPWE